VGGGMGLLSAAVGEGCIGRLGAVGGGADGGAGDASLFGIVGGLANVVDLPAISILSLPTI
jgi:hypothetical protein